MTLGRGSRNVRNSLEPSVSPGGMYALKILQSSEGTTSQRSFACCLLTQLWEPCGRHEIVARTCRQSEVFPEGNPPGGEDGMGLSRLSHILLNSCICREAKMLQSRYGLSLVCDHARWQDYTLAVGNLLGSKESEPRHYPQQPNRHAVC